MSLPREVSLAFRADLTGILERRRAAQREFVGLGTGVLSSPWEGSFLPFGHNPGEHVMSGVDRLLHGLVTAVGRYEGLHMGDVGDTISRGVMWVSAWLAE